MHAARMTTMAAWLMMLPVLASGCGERPEGWLSPSEPERTRQIESHLRGLDVTMAEVGYRFTELYFAGRDGNWSYAKYQAEKIEHAIRLGIERRPKRAASAQPFLSEEIPAILGAIQEEDAAAFDRGMDRLRTACMKCHVAQQVQYITVWIPERRLSPVRTVR